MKLLLDENLSPRLVARLASLFPGRVHVRDIGLKQASDTSVWEYAKRNGFLIVTADADFMKHSERLGAPPKLVHIEKCDFPFAVIEEMLRRNAVRIAELEKDQQQAALVIRK